MFLQEGPRGKLGHRPHQIRLLPTDVLLQNTYGTQDPKSPIDGIIDKIKTPLSVRDPETPQEEKKTCDFVATYRCVQQMCDQTCSFLSFHFKIFTLLDLFE